MTVTFIPEYTFIQLCVWFSISENEQKPKYLLLEILTSNSFKDEASLSVVRVSLGRLPLNGVLEARGAFRDHQPASFCRGGRRLRETRRLVPRLAWLGAQAGAGTASPLLHQRGGS